MFLVDVVCGLLRPAVCLACGAPDAWPCCARCLPAEPDDVGPWPLAADPDVALWALGPYRDALRAALLAGKLDGQPAALTELGRRLGTALGTAGVGADLVTYVAAARVAGLPRDHAERVASGVAAALDLPLVPLLAPAGGPDLGRARGAAGDRGRAWRAGRDLDRADRDVGHTHPAAGDLGRARRAGRPDRPSPSRPPPAARRRLAGGRILLVDDLATTGGTLAGAAATLRQAGAHHVEAAVLAAAPAALGPGPAPEAARRSTSLAQEARWAGSLAAEARWAGSAAEEARWAGSAAPTAEPHPLPPAPRHEAPEPPGLPPAPREKAPTPPRLPPAPRQPRAPPGPAGSGGSTPPRRLGRACPGCPDVGLCPGSALLMGAHCVVVTRFRV
jgi:predicted amidophosphoribosyltransferase